MSELKLFNTLTRKKEVFKPLKDKEVGFYSCGPTVYWYQHIGNMRTYVFNDLLKRILQYNDYKVKHVMNLTDVGHLTSDADTGEDKMELAVKKEHKTANEIADHYAKAFFDDSKKLNIIYPSIVCKATDHVNEQIALIQQLEKKGLTYQTSDGIYFNTRKFKSYGKLAKLKKSGLQAGKRIALGEKKNITDFALWKFSEKPGLRQQEWPSPWGLGFPGWHIECSAMSMKYLGEIFDIHTGGGDHIQIQHTNEIALSEGATGKPFVKYWLHGAFLLNQEGEKVSKSKGGLYTISELETLGYPALSFRYLCLQTHYKKPLKFSLDNLDASKNAYEKIKRKILELKKEEHKGQDTSKEYESKFEKAINDNLNVPKALQVFLEALDDFDFEPKKKLALLEKFDEVLGLGIKDVKKEHIKIPEEVKKLIEQREKARQSKNWAQADSLRQIIKEKGFIVEDKSHGPEIRKAE